MKLMPVLNISDITSKKENLYLTPPDVIVPNESNLEEFAAWNYANTMYGASFYNLPINYLGLMNVPGAGVDLEQGNNLGSNYENSPIYFMYRMITYFLGKQNNTDYSWMSPTQGQNLTIQPGWINGEEISLFVELFQGIFRSTISTAKFSANPLSKDINETKEILYNFMLLMVKHKDKFMDMAANGFQFNPADKTDFSDKGELDDWFAEEYNDEGADICTTMSNGIWNNSNWMQMFMSVFTHIVICGKGAIEHDMINGISRQREIEPYWLITDPRVPDGDDYGEYANLIGYYKPFQYNEIYNYPNLKADQIDMIHQFCTSGGFNNGMGMLPNGMNWAVWNTQKNINETYMIRMYYKGRKYISTKESNNAQKDGDSVKSDDNGYFLEDIYCSDVLAGTYLARWGKCRNKIGKYGNKRYMDFPIQYFQPNTFFGTSVSKVGRVFKFMDEIDMYRYKIRDAVGKSKGKVVFIFGDKAMASVQEIAKDLTEMGAHVMIKDKFDDNPNNRQQLIETVDWGATDDVNKVYMPMIQMLKKNMQEVLSISDTLLGQQASYSGAETSTNIVTGNSYGMSYLMNGTLNFAVRNMRYAVKQQINYNTVKQKVNLEYIIGEKGIEYIDWMNVNSLDWDDIYVQLEINDRIDSEKRKQISDYLFNASQQGQYTKATLETLISLMEVANENSVTAAIDNLKKKVKKMGKEEDAKAQMAAQQQQAAQQAQIASTEKIAQMNNEMATNKALSIEQLKILGGIIQSAITAHLDNRVSDVDKAWELFMTNIQNGHEMNMASQQPQTSPSSSQSQQQ